MKYLKTNEELTNPFYIPLKNKFLKGIERNKQSLTEEGWTIQNIDTPIQNNLSPKNPTSRVDLNISKEGKSYNISVFLVVKRSTINILKSKTEIKFFINGSWVMDTDTIDHLSIQGAISHFERVNIAVSNQEVRKKFTQEFFEEYDEQTIKEYIQDLADCLGKYSISQYKGSSYLIKFEEFELEKIRTSGMGPREFNLLSGDTEWLIELSSLYKLLKNVGLKLVVSIHKDIQLIIVKSVKLDASEYPSYY